MNECPIIPIEERDKALSSLIQILTKDRVAVMPCDTIYGLVGRVPGSEEALRALKGRDADKPFIELITMEMVDSISETAIPEEWKFLWPGPLTLIVKRKNGSGTVALRVPSDPFLIELIERLGTPLYSSSVNISGEKSLHDFDEIVDAFSCKIDLCIRGSEEQGTVASTIVDLSKETPCLIRQGALDVSDLI